MKLHVDRLGIGPDLVLLHGWGLHSGVWAEVLPALSQHFRVHAIDLPGHGFSHAAIVRRFEDAAALVAAQIPDGARLCGWSLGGLLAQRIARDAAGVRALALVSSTPCFVERGDWRHAMKASTLQSFAAGLSTDPKATLDNFVRLNTLHGTRNRQASRVFTSRLYERGMPSVEALNTGLQWLEDIDLRSDAAGIKQRTVIVHGARDALAPIEAGRWLARVVPDATLNELADAAHLPFFTHSSIFVHALESLVG